MKDDIWGDLGEQWWRDTGAACKASEQQIKFAAARHKGASATACAKIAGYEAGANAAAIRQAGHRAVRSTAVLNMLALAKSEGKQTAPTSMDRDARVQLLSDIARSSPDPILKIRAVEGLNKMENSATSFSQTTDSDGFADWRVVRDFLQTPGGGVAVVSLWTANNLGLANLPFLHDVHKKCMAENPNYWERAVSRTELPGRLRLQKQLANPTWKIEARAKIWKEVGVDIELPEGVTAAQVAILPEATGQVGQRTTLHHRRDSMSKSNQLNNGATQ